MPKASVRKIYSCLFAVLLCVAPAILAQEPSTTAPPNTPPAPPETAPPATKEEPDIELNTVLMESTYRIQGSAAQGGTTLGTVFFVGRPIQNSKYNRLVMVTAAHVLEEIQGDTAVLLLRKKVDEKTNSWVPVPFPFKIRTNRQPLWKKHPEADVAAMYIDIPTETISSPPSYELLADDKMLTEYDVKPGDELQCLGYPLGLASNDAGFPVLRSGRIASYPLLPTEKTKTFLLDFRVFKGNSGGPVYFVDLYRPIPHKLGYMSYHFLVGLVSEEILYSEQSGGHYSQELHQTQLGLARVVHASLIKQTIEMLPLPQPE